MGALLALVPRDGGRSATPAPGDFYLDADGRLRAARRRADRAPSSTPARRSSTPAALAASARGVFSLNPVWDALIAEGRLFGHRLARRLGRRRPPRGHRARRGGAGAVTLFAPSRRARGSSRCRPASTSAARWSPASTPASPAQPPEAVARVEIWVNTRRARRALVAAFADGPAAAPAAHPRRDRARRRPAGPAGPAAAGARRSRRKLELARLVGALLARRARPRRRRRRPSTSPTASPTCSTRCRARASTAAAFAGLDAGEHAEHWQRSLRFLALLGDYVAASGRRPRGRAGCAPPPRRWPRPGRSRRPQHPVIVAGSTGSRGATRAFMAAVARLPQGALVLPGFDADAAGRGLGRGSAPTTPAPPTIRRTASARLADALGFDPGAVPPWHRGAARRRPRATRSSSLALRPAPVTDQWRTEGAALAGRRSARRCAGARPGSRRRDPRAEALAIALPLREAAETGARAALVTPDRDAGAPGHRRARPLGAASPTTAPAGRWR